LQAAAAAVAAAAAAAAVTSGHYTDNKIPRYTRLHIVVTCRWGSHTEPKKGEGVPDGCCWEGKVKQQQLLLLFM